MRFHTLPATWVAVLALLMLIGCSTTYNDGTRALEAGNLALAEQLLVRAIREGDNLPESWNNLGVVYARTDDLNEPFRATPWVPATGTQSLRPTSGKWANRFQPQISLLPTHPPQALNPAHRNDLPPQTASAIAKAMPVPAVPAT